MTPSRSLRFFHRVRQPAQDSSPWSRGHPPLTSCRLSNASFRQAVSRIISVKPGQRDNFQALTGEMVESSSGESGVLSYQRFVSEDGKIVYAYERYADSIAVLAHLRTFEKTFGGRFNVTVDRRRFTVFGNPTDELRRALDRFGATYLRPFGDFAYWA